eukprot:6035903-Amphidinium_carterae.1
MSHHAEGKRREWPPHQGLNSVGGNTVLLNLPSPRSGLMSDFVQESRVALESECAALKDRPLAQC